MGTNPHIDPWNYLFHAQLHQGSNTEATTLGNVDCLSDLGLELTRTFTSRCLTLRSGWRRAWFFLRNDADAPLLTFTGSHPIPKPN
jgi:hypothetical protein